MSASSLRSFEYLEGLPGTTFNRLYKQPSTALAIFRRMLPHLGMLWIVRNGPFVGADEPSQELCDGPTVHQPPYAGHRSGGLGAPRWETVCKKAIGYDRSDICEENETPQSTFLKDSIF